MSLAPTVSEGGSGSTEEFAEILRGFRKVSGQLCETSKHLDTFIRQFTTLRDLIELTSRISDINELMDLVLEKGMSATGSKIGTVMLVREEGDGLEIVTTRGWTPNIVGPIDPAETLAGRVIESGKPLLVTDIDSRKDLSRENDSSRYRSPSFLILPLGTRTSTIGAVCLSEKFNQDVYTQQDKDFLSVLLGQVGFAVENARLLKQERDTAKRLAGVVEQQNLQIRQARRQSFHAEKLSSVGQMIAGVAHELNNPLASILGRAEILIRSKTDSPSGKKDEGGDEDRDELQTIFAETKRAQKIVRNLLSFAQLRTGVKSPINLNEVVENIVDLRRYELRNRDIDLSTDLDPALPITVADADRIQQLLLNLLNNSVQAMPSKGLRQIRIGTYRNNDRIRFQISDTGHGIPKSVTERIFEPFFTTKPGRAHSGLGLTLSKEIIEEHGGEIEIETEEGRGTIVVFEFPVVEPALRFEKESRFESTDFPNVKNQAALVVDDDEPNAQMITKMLRSVGFRAEFTTSGNEALQRIHHERFALVVCDLFMPELDGKSLYREVQKINPGVAKRFLFTTGDISDPQIRYFAEYNGVQVVLKPFTVDELLNAVRKTIFTIAEMEEG